MEPRSESHARARRNLWGWLLALAGVVLFLVSFLIHAFTEFAHSGFPFGPGTAIPVVVRILIGAGYLASMALFLAGIAALLRSRRFLLSFCAAVSIAAGLLATWLAVASWQASEDRRIVAALAAEDRACVQWGPPSVVLAALEELMGTRDFNRAVGLKIASPVRMQSLARFAAAWGRTERGVARYVGIRRYAGSFARDAAA